MIPLSAFCSYCVDFPGLDCQSVTAEAKESNYTSTLKQINTSKGKSVIPQHTTITTHYIDPCRQTLHPPHAPEQILPNSNTQILYQTFQISLFLYRILTQSRTQIGSFLLHKLLSISPALFLFLYHDMQ